MENIIFKEFAEKVLRHSKVAIFSHVRPDGDCIGSQVALSLWLQKNGVEAAAFNEDSLPANISWMSDFMEILSPAKADLTQFDAFIFVDGNALHRFGDTAKKFENTDKPLYMIDHHPDPEPIFDVSISKTSHSSTCELVFNLYESHDPDQIDTEAAMAMFAGIVTDTGSFQFDSVTSETMRAGSELLRRGSFKPSEVAEKIYSTRPARQLKLLSQALETISLYAEGQLATISITEKMMQETSTTKEDTEGFVAYPLSIEGVKACVLLREGSDGVKLSLRSKSDVDVNIWAREFNGGGHKKAAGAIHPGPLESAIKEVIKVGEEQL